MQFIWDNAKAEANERKHGVKFTTATEVFLDPGRYEEPDDRNSRGEERWRTVGIGGERILFVVFTERQGDIIRIISAQEPARQFHSGRFFALSALHFARFSHE